MKSALIFGGSRGIGKAVAETFISNGFCVSIVGRTRKEVEATVKKLSFKGDVLGHQADISVYNKVKEATYAHLSKFKSLDVLVNTAAIQGPIGPLWENDPESWRYTVLTNLLGSFNVCRAALPLMLKNGYGTLVLFSGGGAVYARPKFSAYGASKTGVLRLVETVHDELMEVSGKKHFSSKSGVRIYAVAPGAVYTRMTAEILADKKGAGKKAYEEAMRTKKGSGSLPEKAAELCWFLAWVRPVSLSGKLIHVNEPYHKYLEMLELDQANSKKKEYGLLRRVPFK